MFPWWSMTSTTTTVVCLDTHYQQVPLARQQSNVSQNNVIRLFLLFHAFIHWSSRLMLRGSLMPRFCLSPSCQYCYVVIMTFSKIAQSDLSSYMKRVCRTITRCVSRSDIDVGRKLSLWWMSYRYFAWLRWPIFYRLLYDNTDVLFALSNAWKSCHSGSKQLLQCKWRLPTHRLQRLLRGGTKSTSRSRQAVWNLSQRLIQMSNMTVADVGHACHYSRWCGRCWATAAVAAAEHLVDEDASKALADKTVDDNVDGRVEDQQRVAGDVGVA